MSEDTLPQFLLDEKLRSRAQAFHRAVERLFHATRGDGFATGNPEMTFRAAKRRWKELERALRRTSPDVFALSHLESARSLWSRMGKPSKEESRV